MASGLTDAAIRTRVRGGRWQRLFPGVFATFSGTVPRAAKLWAAVLYAATVALADVGAGCHSELERRYLHDVERAHGLPTGQRQGGRRSARRRYDDVRYPEHRLVVELDGRVAHPDEARWRDIHRDNETVADGDRVLRYGWLDVTKTPCATADRTARALRSGGWPGEAVHCARADCCVGKVDGRGSSKEGSC